MSPYYYQRFSSQQAMIAGRFPTDEHGFRRIYTAKPSNHLVCSLLIRVDPSKSVFIRGESDSIAPLA
jgi:hypothetical protein